MYHNMNYSMIPITLSVVLLITTANVMYVLYESYSMTTVLVILLLTLMMQYMVMVKESYSQCTNTKVIKESMRVAFIMFLVMEFMAFNSLFWGYFHFTLTENWPPMGIIKCNPLSLPLLNTCLLLTSALSLTVFHDYIMQKKHSNYLSYMHITIMLGVMFIFMQYEEYKDHLMFSLSDGIYGSIFYSLTGFHGSHVMIGIVMLMATLNLSKYATYSNHKGINAAIWYWHFVDVIWIFLFIFVYMY